MALDSKRKILQILPEMETGGVERGVYDLATFKNDKYEILVASKGGKLANKIIDEKVKHFEINLKSKNIFVMFLNIFKLRKIIKNNSISVIHARSRAPAWSAYFAAKLSGIPFITTFHGFYGRSNFLKNFYNSVMTKGKIVISVSNFMKEHIVKYYGIDESKIEVIHRGVDVREFDPDKITEEEKDNFKAELGLSDPQRKIILLPGRVSRWKGHDTAIKALANIAEDVRPLLVCAGSWKGKESFYKELNKLVEEKNLSNSVIFTGNLTNLPIAYSISDLCLNCSREPETFGRVTAEAGSMRKPVIATNIGGSREIVKEGETGSLIDVEDDLALSKAIISWLEYIQNDEKQEETARKCRDHIVENFSLEKMCRKTFATYDLVLEHS